MFDPAVLDDPARLAARDPSGMLTAVEGSLDQWRDGFARARGAGLTSKPDALVVCGMGGSGIAGDVVAAIAATRASVPVAVVKGYHLPAWVGSGARVVAISYSGDTAETVMCLEDARRRGCEVVVVAGGGALAAAATDASLPRIEPEKGLMPRAAFPSLAASALAAAEGAVPGLSDLETELVPVLQQALAKWGSAVPGDRNEAKLLALSLAGGTPSIWGQEGVLAVGAQRWKCQMNENAKMPASWAVAPEALHNAIVSLEKETVVLLRSDVEQASLARALDAVAASNPAVIVARVPGDGDLALLASAVLFGDLVSVYCAALLEVDPTPVEPIARLKRDLVE